MPDRQRAHDANRKFSGLRAFLAERDAPPVEVPLKPELTPPERTVAQVEGWILGVPGLS